MCKREVVICETTMASSSQGPDREKAFGDVGGAGVQDKVSQIPQPSQKCFCSLLIAVVLHSASPEQMFFT